MHFSFGLRKNTTRSCVKILVQRAEVRHKNALVNFKPFLFRVNSLHFTQATAFNNRAFDFFRIFSWPHLVCVLGFLVCSASVFASDPVTIISPSKGSSVNTNTVEVEYTFDPEVVGAEPKVALKIDGQNLPATRGMRVKGEDKPVASASAEASSRIREKQTIQVPSKDCTLQIIVTSMGGAQHETSVSIKWTGAAEKAEEKNGKLHALVIGISEYADPSLRLKLAAKDARDFAEMIKRQEGGFYTSVEVKMLLNADATRGSIIDALDELRAIATESDTVMIFLAGHGTNEGGQFYFVSQDADQQKVRKTCVPFADIQSTATGLPSRVVVFLDSCHSGGIGGGGSVGNDITDVLRGWQKSPTAKGAVIFSSSTGQQLSQENMVWGNGAFTKALLEGLSGEAHPDKAGPVCITMLEGFIAKRVADLTKNQQTPTTTKSLDLSDFNFAFAGDVREQKARLDEENYNKAAEEQAIAAFRDAFVAQQTIIQKRGSLKSYQDQNNDGWANDLISKHQKEIADKKTILTKSLALLNEISQRNSIIVGKAIAIREEQLANDLKTASTETAAVATSAMSELKKQISLPTSY